MPDLFGERNLLCMKLIFGSRRKGKLLIKLMVLSFFVYFISLLVSQRVTLSRRSADVEGLKKNLSVQEAKIGEVKSEIEDIKSGAPRYMEDFAHKNSKPYNSWERVFVNAKGN